MVDPVNTGAVSTPQAVWKILVVDDEPAIHQVTKLALRNLVVLGRPCQLINALSARDAREQLAQHPDIAVVLLDVVMETEDAGLEFVRHIRGAAANPLLRIILRTGQPGQAPERQVMVDYDINDYKEKTELTASKLFTSVTASIRTFAYLLTMEDFRRAAAVLGPLGGELLASSSDAALAACLVEQALALQLVQGVWVRDANDGVLARAGNLPQRPDALAMLAKAGNPGTVAQLDDAYATCLQRPHGAALQLFLAADHRLAPHAHYLVTLFLQSCHAALRHSRAES